MRRNASAVSLEMWILWQMKLVAEPEESLKERLEETEKESRRQPEKRTSSCRETAVSRDVPEACILLDRASEAASVQDLAPKDSRELLAFTLRKPIDGSEAVRPCGLRRLRDV
jgi:uncharacterized protein (DUF2344 family)